MTKKDRAEDRENLAGAGAEGIRGVGGRDRKSAGAGAEETNRKSAGAGVGGKQAGKSVGRTAGKTAGTGGNGGKEAGAGAEGTDGKTTGKKARKKKKGNHRVSNFLLFLILLVGMGIMAYPSFSEYWNNLHQSRAIMGYAERVAEMTNEEYEGIWNSAIEYNRQLLELPNRWVIEHDEELSEDYNSQLNIEATGNMGFISIPKIDVNLPIYHGTSDAVLQTSIGHITGTSLPAGSSHSDEENFLKADFASHSVLSGHRGLPSARLFSDLDALEVGDLFYLNILDQTLTYEVDQITVIEPEDLTELEILPGRDLCTLMTCTPYGINTHRLMVRGSRIENEKQRLNVRVTADALRIKPAYVAPFIAGPVLILMIFWVLLMTGHKGRRS